MDGFLHVFTTRNGAFLPRELAELAELAESAIGMYQYQFHNVLYQQALNIQYTNIYIYTYIYCVHTDSHDHVTLVGGLKVIGSCGVSEYAKLDQSKAQSNGL